MAQPNRVHVRVFEFTKADFASVPGEDRRILILGGHLLNQLGVWAKFLAATVNAKTADSVIDSMNAAQSQIIVRTLVGTMFEGWKWMNSRETSSRIRDSYLDELPPSSAAAYRRLGKHFGSGLFAKVRDNFAYHFPDREALEVAFDATPDEQPFSWYMSDENTNSLYFGCEAVIGHGVYGLAKETNGRSGIMRLIPEATAAINDINEFLQGLLSCVVGRHLGHCSRSQFLVEGVPGPSYALPFLLHEVFGSALDE